MSRSSWALAGCVVFALAARLAFAQEHTAPAAESGHTPAVAHGEHEKPALLQFDPGAAVWTIVVFVLLLVVLRLVAWKPILRVLQEREEFIARSLSDAKREREEAQKQLDEYRAQLERARLEATAIVEEGRRDAEVVAQRLKDDARRESEQLLERARRDIKLAADAAVKELYDQTADLSVRIASGILQREVSADEHRALVAESLQRMRATDGTRLN